MEKILDNAERKTRRIIPLPSLSPFERCNKDACLEIAKYLDAKSLVVLAATGPVLNEHMMDDAVWKFACLRDLHIPTSTSVPSVAFNWINLYRSAFDGSHSCKFRQQENHIAWARIGAFSFDSSVAVLAAKRLAFPGNIRTEEGMKNMLLSQGCFMLDNVKPGIWIADLHIEKCPCGNNSCNGKIMVLDARHIELFLCEDHKKGNWDYELVGSHAVKKRVDAATAGIFDFKHLGDSSTAAVFDYNSWIGNADDNRPKTRATIHAVAVHAYIKKKYSKSSSEIPYYQGRNSW